MRSDQKRTTERSGSEKMKIRGIEMRKEERRDERQRKETRGERKGEER